MKNILLGLLLLGITAWVGCENESTEKQPKTIPFAGEWTRDFQIGQGPDSTAHISYRFAADSIQYEMAGLMSIKYTITVDTFIEKDNRWLGMLNDVPYVIFVQPVSKDSINLFKKKVKNLASGLSMEVPGADARSRFTSWNIFVKKQ